MQTQNLGNLETLATDFSRWLVELDKNHAEIKAEHMSLKEEWQQIEDHSRKFNIHVLGIPDVIENNNPTSLICYFLCEVFSSDELGHVPPAPGRAYTSQVVWSQGCLSWRRSRPLRGWLERLLAIWCTSARECTSMQILAEMVKKSASFNEVRTHLWDAKVRYGLLFPCRLIVTFRDITVTLTDSRRQESQCMYRSSNGPEEQQCC